MLLRILPVILSGLYLTALLPVGAPVAAEPSGADIVQRCDIDKNPGKDQRSTLTVILRDSAGNEKKSVYDRYWKAYGGKDEVYDKMVLFTEFPPDARGTGFMRIGYVPESGKTADQLIYLPQLNTTRHVSIRDPGDSFLGSELTYWDIGARNLDQDTHQLLRTEQEGGHTYYVVESAPRNEENPLYRKRVSWYQQAPAWQDCNKTRIEYYDPRGLMSKIQTFKWQKVGDAWVWDEVVVQNLKTGRTSVFQVSDAAVNVGLKDRIFTERTLKQGVR